jgi:hypothetical protein
MLDRERLEPPVDRIEAPINALQGSSGVPGDLFQDGDPTFHIGRIPAASGRFNGRVWHGGSLLRCQT